MTTYSFYIPRVCRTYTEDQIKIVFSDVLMIGDVKRVDFVPISKRFQRAFVHMDFFYNVETTNEIRTKVFKEGKPVWVYPSQLFKNPLLKKVEQNFCSLFPKKRLIDNHVYWILLKNNNPLPETIMNISQIANQMNTIVLYLKTLNDKIESIDKPNAQRPLGSLLDKMFNNPFSFIHFYPLLSTF